jgi:putative FmdB family regulatory protein
MPIYEYLCAECRTKFEKLVLRKNSEPVACPQCGRTAVEQVFSTFAISGGNGQTCAGADKSTSCGATPSGGFT